MMDFDNILDLASQNQGLTNVQKRYSLQTGPPKKDPRSKNVNPAAIQALLNKQHVSAKKKEMKFRKEKEELLAKRVEMKSDRKARAMASRTKDNFKGYNGIPVVEVVKKRKSKNEMQEERSANAQGFGDDLDDIEDNYEYEQSDSESEPEPLRTGKLASASGASGGANGSKSSSKQHKPAQNTMNFADLLKLAEKKQFEPVDLKPKITKKEERLRTAEEIRELEMERKAKRTDKKPERGQDGKSGSSSTRASTLEKEKRDCKPQKVSTEKQVLPSGSGKKLQSDQRHSSSKTTVRDKEKERPKISHSDRDRPKSSLTSSCGATNSKAISKTTSSQVVTKQRGPKPTLGHKSSTSSDLSSKREGPASLPGRALGIPGTRPVGTAVAGQKSQTGSSQQTRPSQGSSVKQGGAVGVHKSGKGEPPKTGIHSSVKSNGNSVMRSSSSVPPKAGGQTQQMSRGPSQAKSGAVQARPGGSGLQIPQGRGGSRPPGAGFGRPGSGGSVAGRPSTGMGTGPGRPSTGMGTGPGRPSTGMGTGPGRPSTGMGTGPGRPSTGMGTGPGRPKCTVVSETISSKNVGGARPGVPPRPSMTQRPAGPPRPGVPPRPMMNRPPGPMLPPITSAYKRKYEDEEDEYDSEMDDFIDDGGEEQQEISRHIREIFGYDRNRYKDESDYALKFMESSWKDMQKEEARSLRMAVQEDQEEERREEEEMKMKSAKRTKKN